MLTVDDVIGWDAGGSVGTRLEIAHDDARHRAVPR